MNNIEDIGKRQYEQIFISFSIIYFIFDLVLLDKIITS